VKVHPALGGLMAVSLLLSVTWALVTPAFQAPDEQYHFAYVQSLAERHALPGDATRPSFSTQMVRGIAGVNSDQVAAQLDVRPEWSERAERRWEARDAHAARDDSGGPNPASPYPPTSYAWEALGYAAASGGSLFDALLGARLMSALWLPLTVLGAWLLAGEVFGRRRVLQTAAAAVPALAPMVGFMTGAVNPDGMLYAVSTLALWAGVRAIRRDVPARDAAVFFALVAIACTIKTASVALLPAAALVAGVGVWARRHRRASVARFCGALAVPLLLALGIWALAADLADQSFASQIVESTSPVGTGSSAREFFSYLWQFYLPRTPIQYKYAFGAGGPPLISIWITHGWAAFGWLEVRFWGWVYWALGTLSLAIGIAAVVALVRARRRVDARVAAFLGLAALTLLAGLHWTDYRQLEAGAPGFMQTRYLFPLIGVFGLALAGALSLVPANRRAGAVGATIAALFAFHLLSLGLVLERFYAYLRRRPRRRSYRDRGPRPGVGLEPRLLDRGQTRDHRRDLEAGRPRVPGAHPPTERHHVRPRRRRARHLRAARSRARRRRARRRDGPTTRKRAAAGRLCGPRPCRHSRTSRAGRPHRLRGAAASVRRKPRGTPGGGRRPGRHRLPDYRGPIERTGPRHGSHGEPAERPAFLLRASA
jgi:hypothetical protein